MKIKKSISLFLASAMLAAIVPATAAQAASKTTLAVGDKIQIGSYGEGNLNEPVEYKVMGKRDADGDGDLDLFLASTKIVTVKPISKWQAVLYKGAVGNTSLASDLRGWLNSDAASYTSAYAPSGDNATAAINGTAGFMSKMASYEKAQIVDANLTSLVGISKDTVKSGGVSDVSGTVVPSLDATAYWPGAWTSLSSDYENLQKVSHTDKVFIPSIEELYTFFGGDNIISNIDAAMTAAALSENGGNEITEKQIWLRDNIDTDATTVKSKRVQLKVDTQGEQYIQILNTVGTRDMWGIRPCMYLKADTEIERADAEGIVYKIKRSLAVGDKVQIGTYAGSPVEYKIMGSRDVDSDGDDELFLASTKIVSFKGYNAGAAPNVAVTWKANNVGRQPSLRVWLNSNETVVDYGTEQDGTTQVVPAYSEQPGFMAGMTAYEQSQIVPVTQNSVVADHWDTEHKTLPFDGGSGRFMTWDQQFPSAYTNNELNKYAGSWPTYENAAYVTTTDKVFIPSLKDLYDFFGGNVNNATAVANLNVELTSAAQTEGATTPATLLRDMYYHDSDKLNMSIPFRWNGANYVVGGSFDANRASNPGGIRPCMYIKANAGIELVEGETDLYELAEPSDQASCYIEYAQTTGGTVLRGTVYNDGAETKNYMLIIAKYDQTDHNRMIGADVYRFSVAPYQEGYTDSTVLDCGSEDPYTAFLWEEDSIRPLTAVFPIDLSD